MSKSKKFKDYLKFRSILLDNNIKDEGELAKFLGFSRSAASTRFSNPATWRLEDLRYMSVKFKKPMDELYILLEIPN